MRKGCVWMCVIGMLILLSGCSGKTVSADKGESVFGVFTTTDMAGNPVNEQVFSEHKLTMVNIWATFCSPCIREMPDLAQLQTEFGDSFQIVGIVVDAGDRNGMILPHKIAEAASIIEATGAKYLHLLPSASLNKAYLSNVQTVPETIFIDENGNQVGEKYYGAKSKSDWKMIIDTLLGSLS